MHPMSKLSRPKVAIDARHLHSGIGTYISQLILHLQDVPRDFDLALVTVIENRKRIEALGCNDVRVVEGGLYSVRAQRSVPRAVADCDLFHSTQYDVPLLRNKPIVVTIHDLIHLEKRFARHLGVWLGGHVMLRLALHKASHVITVSEHTNAEVLRRLHVSRSRVTTIYNGLSPAFLLIDRASAERTAREVTGVSRPYILYVGNLAAHKNLDALLRAFSAMPKSGINEHDLVIVGTTQSKTADLSVQVERLNLAHRIHFLPYVAFELLPAVYRAASVLVLPSFIEGFGFPVIEAMACGTPVVCSRATSLPEVGGDAAEYFDPNQPNELAAKLRYVLSSAERRDEMYTKGLAQARRFSWRAAAQKHVEVYQRILQIGMIPSR